MIEQQLRDTCRKLLEEGTVKVVIGYGGSTQPYPVFITDPAQVDELVWNDHCFQNLTHYLTRKEVKKLGKPAIVEVRTNPEQVTNRATIADLRARFVPFVDWLVAAHGTTDRNILLITHGSLLYLMLPLALTHVDFASVREYPMPNTGVIIAERQVNGLVCLDWCGSAISK